MADTIVTNSPGTNDSSAVGMVVALVVVVAVIVVGIVMYQRGFFNNGATPTDTNINVTIPTPTGGTGNTTP